MSEMEKKELKERIEALTLEEQDVVLESIPFDVVWSHVINRVTTLVDQRDQMIKFFDKFSDGE